MEKEKSDNDLFEKINDLRVNEDIIQCKGLPCIYQSGCLYYHNKLDRKDLIIDSKCLMEVEIKKQIINSFEKDIIKFFESYKMFNYDEFQSLNENIKEYATLDIEIRRLRLVIMEIEQNYLSEMLPHEIPKDKDQLLKRIFLIYGINHNKYEKGEVNSKMACEDLYQLINRKENYKKSLLDKLSILKKVDNMILSRDKFKLDLMKYDNKTQKDIEKEQEKYKLSTKDFSNTIINEIKKKDNEKGIKKIKKLESIKYIDKIKEYES